ncbi:MAG: hypothetical protein HOQ26_01330 [Gemmatimonadaceae bacterium]|nr:hypothetical protein [Gemmatimonadaceae bacterium]NUQ91530.1 hypothetical protein [Gemmatimonadaceae bacterium]
MARTLSAAMQSDVVASPAETVRLLELQFGGGTVRYCTGSSDLTWNGVTWSAIGGAFTFAPTPESADFSASSGEITLSAVSGTIAQTIAGETFIGRLVQLYVAHIDPSTRAVIVDPLLTQRGYMSGGWEIREGLDTITATVRCVSRLVVLSEHRGIQLNLVSHQQSYPNDVFFTQIAQQLTQPVTWGKTRIRLV